MPAYKDSRQGTWYASFYFENWQGVKQKKLKRGFTTKKDALAWEREFLLQQAADLTMTFEAFVDIYITDKKKRLRENTWSVKEHLANAFRDGEIKTVGTDIDKLMPPVSRFGGGGRAQKKQGVIDKLKSFFDKFFGIGNFT